MYAPQTLLLIGIWVSRSRALLKTLTPVQPDQLLHSLGSKLQEHLCCSCLYKRLALFAIHTLSGKVVSKLLTKKAETAAL